MAFVPNVVRTLMHHFITAKPEISKPAINITIEINETNPGIMEDVQHGEPYVAACIRHDANVAAIEASLFASFDLEQANKLIPLLDDPVKRQMKAASKASVAKEKPATRLEMYKQISRENEVKVVKAVKRAAKKMVKKKNMRPLTAYFLKK
jgi:hypothetical protein